MRVLLAVDGSACSDMAVQTVIDRFRPENTQVRVLHAVEWMREMPLCFQYAHGPKAGDDVADAGTRVLSVRVGWWSTLPRSSSSRASIRACRYRTWIHATSIPMGANPRADLCRKCRPQPLR